jgi:hypothetical protein
VDPALQSLIYLIKLVYFKEMIMPQLLAGVAARALPMLGGAGGAGGGVAGQAAGMMGGLAKQMPGLQMLQSLTGGQESGGAQKAGGAGGSDQVMQIIKMLIEALTGGKGAEKSGEGGKDSPCSQSADKLASDKGHKGKSMDEAGSAGGDLSSMLSQLPAGTTITIGGGGQ